MIVKKMELVFLGAGQDILDVGNILDAFVELLYITWNWKGSYDKVICKQPEQETEQDEKCNNVHSLVFVVFHGKMEKYRYACKHEQGYYHTFPQ